MKTILLMNLYHRTLEILFFISILSTCLIAGIIGSLLGLGGGFIIVPALTLLFDIPIHLAIGASFIGVLVNSSSASLVYIKNGMTDIKLSSILELGAVIGAIIGASISLTINSNILSIIFGLTLTYVSINMYIKSRTQNNKTIQTHKKSKITKEYFKDISTHDEKYSVTRVKEGVILSSIGGLFAGLLGVGGGVIFVPIMNRIMNVPIKAAIATSSFMIAMTSLIGAIIFIINGYFYAEIIPAIILGVFIGAQIGARVNKIINKKLLSNVFSIVVIYIAIRMLFKGLEINLV